MEKLVSLAKRRGFVFQSSEIYGGLGSVWDYGPLGVELKKNIKERWWRSMVHERHDIEGLDAAILMHPKVWEASGHVSGFTDPLVDCKHCKNRFRADDPKITGPSHPVSGGRWRCVLAVRHGEGPAAIPAVRAGQGRRVAARQHLARVVRPERREAAVPLAMVVPIACAQQHTLGAAQHRR